VLSVLGFGFNASGFRFALQGKLTLKEITRGSDAAMSLIVEKWEEGFRVLQEEALY
jgi:hypothetical protein